MTATPISPEVAKQARLDYQTSRDAIVDVVNDRIGEIEQIARNKLVELHNRMLTEQTHARHQFIGQQIDASDYRDIMNELRERANAERALIIERRSAELGKIDAYGREALDAAKAVYREVVGAPFPA